MNVTDDNRYQAMNSEKPPASAETSDMEFKLRRRVVRKVMTDIHGQVREIEEQESKREKGPAFAAARPAGDGIAAVIAVVAAGLA